MNSLQSKRNSNLCRTNRKNILLYLIVSCLVFLADLPGIALASTDPWVLVDTHSRTLSVYNAGEILREFKNISIGRGGAASERFKGDGKTPLGTFHIMWLNMKSHYHIFLGLDYPNLDHATQAYRKKQLKSEEFKSIQDAMETNTIPPQDTPLGGYIGIHGIGEVNPKFQGKLNWTDGCIALTNEQVEQLVQMVQVGTEVIIR